MSKAQNGNNVTIHYVGTLDDGKEFDNSKVRGEPMSFQLGSGQVIPGFNSEVLGMSPGETKEFSIPCGEAYGDRKEEAVQYVPIASFPEGFEFEPGMMIQGTSPDGQAFQAKIVGLSDDTVTVDFNHPLAGKDLNFDIEVVEIHT